MNKNIDKSSQLKIGAILSYISMILGYIISIVYTPIMLRILGQHEYGLYSLVSSIVSYLGLLSFGFGSSYMRFYSRYKINNDEKNISKLNGMFLIIFSLIGIITLLSGLILSINPNVILGNNISDSELSIAKILLIVMVINLTLSLTVSVFNSYVMANEEFIFQKLLQMVKTITSPFIMLPVLLMGFGSIGMVIVTTTINFIVELLNIIFCIKKLKIQFSFNKFDFSLMKEMTVFSSFIFINMIIDQINWNVDKLIIGRFRGTVEVAIYGLAAQLNTYYMSLSVSISNVFIPRVNKIVASNNDNIELTNLIIRVGRVQFIILSLISTGLIFFGRPFINMWAGFNYNEAYPIALLLIISGTVPLIQNVGIEIQKAKNMHQFRSWIYLGIAIVNICISIPLTKLYGGMGAAFGTALALLLGNGLIMNLYYHYNVGLNMKFFWSQILMFLPAFIIPVTIGTLMNLFVNLNNILSFIFGGLFYVLTFFISMWFFGFNKYEKDLLSKPLNLILKINLRR